MKKLTALALALCLLFAGCKTPTGSDIQEPVEDGSEADTAVDAFTAGLDAQASPVTAVRTVMGTQVKLTAHPIASDGQYAALVVDYELIGGVAGQTNNLELEQFLSVDSTTATGPKSLRLFDLPSQTAWLQLPKDKYTITGAFRKTDEKTVYASSQLSEKTPFVSSITLYAAPKGQAALSVFIPKFGVIPNVPIVSAEGGLDKYIETAGQPLAGAEEGYVVGLRRFLADYEGEMFVVGEADQATITIASDVLFATDKHELTKEAQDTILRAAEAIKAEYSGGIVQLIGHTDDVASDEYNQALSERRAESVRAALEPLLGSGYSVTAEGRGEKEPIAQGTSAEARALNRRVDIVMPGANRTDTHAETIPSSQINPADYPTAQGGTEWLTYRQGDENTSLGSKLFKIKVEKVVRVEGGLVGYLRLGLMEGGEYPSLDRALFWYSSGATLRDMTARGYGGGIQAMEGTEAVSLLTAEGRLYGYDFVRDEGTASAKATQMLCGDYLFGPARYDLQSGMLVTMIWPDPGTDTVTIDVNGAFRIEGVAVENDASLAGADY